MRACIFCFHDKEGVVDRYVDFLLADLRNNVDYLHIVVNGIVCDIGKAVLGRYADSVTIRDNKGFDVGAYKDIIINIMKPENLQKYDELVLCNDTFYGPFLPFQNIFEEMDKKNIDFWGLKYVEDSFFSHLQSYFLVFRSAVVKNNLIYNYFDKYIDSKASDIAQVYARFERGLFNYLTKNGYRYGSYVLSQNCDDYRSGNFSLRDERMPILKKKMFNDKYYIQENAIDALQIISSVYDIKMILESVKRLYGKLFTEDYIKNYVVEEKKLNSVKIPTMRITEEDFRQFCQSCDSIYIYGAGIVAASICFYYIDVMPKLQGYIVSDCVEIKRTSINGRKIFRLSDIGGA